MSDPQRQHPRNSPAIAVVLPFRIEHIQPKSERKIVDFIFTATLIEKQNKE